MNCISWLFCQVLLAILGFVCQVTLASTYSPKMRDWMPSALNLDKFSPALRFNLSPNQYLEDIASDHVILR